MRSIAACLLATAWLCANAQSSVALTGVMGERALLVIDGGAPVVLSPGEARDGVTLVSARGETAVIQIGGTNQNLRVGENPVSVAGKDAGSGTGKRVILHAGVGGHFYGTGKINGVTMQFVVDTGASDVVLGFAQAEAMGLNYRSGRQYMVSTANGDTLSYGMNLDTVRVGDVEIYHVDASIVPSSIPVVLLGNAFLRHFQIRQENDQMVLEKKF